MFRQQCHEVDKLRDSNQRPAVKTESAINNSQQKSQLKLTRGKIQNIVLTANPRVDTIHKRRQKHSQTETMPLSLLALVALALLGDNVFGFQNHAIVSRGSNAAFLKPTISREIGSVQPGLPQSRLFIGGMEEFITGRDEKTRKAENDKYLAELQRRVDKINELEAEIEELDDDELIEKTQEFKERLKNGENLDGPLLEEAYAVVREAAW